MIATINHARSTTTESEKDRWRTPLDRFAWVERQYGPVHLDVAADATNHLTDYWLGDGGLYHDAVGPRISWSLYDLCGRGGPDEVTHCYANPPYSRRQVARWVAKADAQAATGRVCVTLLVPAATDSPWWHDYVWCNAHGCVNPWVEVVFLRGPVRFLRPDGSPAGTPTFASVVVHFAARGQR